MSDIIERLKLSACGNCQTALDKIERLQALLDQYRIYNTEWESKYAWLQAEIQDWHECALYDALMSGPVFKGWNRSALERCRVKYVDKERKE